MTTGYVLIHEPAYSAEGGRQRLLRSRTVHTKTSEIEAVTFANPITNVAQLRGGNLTVEMAALARDAYDDDPSLPEHEMSRGWLPLSAIELGMNPRGFARFAHSTIGEGLA
jgi:hypothetical protein